MPPNASHPAILHRKTDEFFIVLEGSSIANIDGKRHKFSKGGFAFLPRGTTHQFTAGRQGTKVLSLFLPALDLDQPDIVPAENKRPKKAVKLKLVNKLQRGARAHKTVLRPKFNGM